MVNVLVMLYKCAMFQGNRWCALWTCLHGPQMDTSHVREEFTNTKKLVKKLERIKASSICPKLLANLFADCLPALVGRLTSPANHVTMKMQETGPMDYSTYPRRLERLNICRYNYKGSRFSGRILNFAEQLLTCPVHCCWFCESNPCNFVIDLVVSFWPDFLGIIENIWKMRKTSLMVMVLVPASWWTTQSLK